MFRIFIDGSAGTTGLRIRERLSGRPELTLLTLPEDRRKDASARQEALAQADVAFLCLPDEAARETAALAEGLPVTLIDTSTAHRTQPGWVYGFPELSGRRERLAAAPRIANPGCHASGFLALVEPLVSAGLIAPDTPLCCFSLTGYSGGGKRMITDYEAPGCDPAWAAPRQYGVGQTHKHLPEMTAVAGLSCPPVFCPVVGDYYSGMEVTVPLFASQLNGTPEAVRALYRDLYRGPVVRYTENAGEQGFYSAMALAGRDDMEITVAGNDERLLLIARFDNLGKGASGAAIQNMNLRLGLPETAGLVLE